MASYRVEDLVLEVKVLLDRNRTSTALINDADVETLQQDALIEPRIQEAVRLIEQYAPVSMLSDAETVSCNSDTYTFTMPILRVLGVRGTEWKRSARMITPDDEEYSYQHSAYGVKGNNERPFCAIIEDGGYVMLEFIPSTNVTISYLPIPTVNDGSIAICEACKDAVVYAAASLVSNAMGDVSGYNALLATAYQMAGISNKQDSQQ